MDEYKREIDLISYLPPYVQDYAEIKKIMTAEEPEFNLTWEKVEELRKNLFVETADIQGIKMFERMLKLLPYPYDSEDVRKERILTRIRNIPPYTLIRFREMLEDIYGKGNVDIELYHKIYEIYIEVFLEEKFNSAESLSYLSRTIIPANMKYFLFASIPTMGFLSKNVFNTNSFGFGGKAFFYGDDVIKLDGKYLLDGSWILNQEFTKNFRFKRFEVKGINAETSADSSIKQYIFDGINIKNKRSESKPTSFIFAGRAKEDTYEDIKELSVKGFRNVIDMNFSGVELIKDSMWKLDGNINLNGSRLLNADIIKEVI